MSIWVLKTNEKLRMKKKIMFELLEYVSVNAIMIARLEITSKFTHVQKALYVI